MTGACNRLIFALSLQVADPQLRKKTDFTSISYFLKRFPCVLPEGSTPDAVEQEFNDFTAETEFAELEGKEEAQECWQLLAAVKDHNGSPR